MSAGIRLIVGLGNPGPKYENTRHNAGAWFVLALAETAGVTFKQESRFHGGHAILREQGKDHQPVDLHLLLPSTFMNLSGQSVAALARYYDIPTETILVVHDEIDLPLGDIRLKFDGGHGGHNGLRDIISHLDTPRFYRLRVGIDHPGHRDDVLDYVLNTPGKQERQQINTALLAAVAILPALLAGKYQQAMHTLHSREK